MNNAVEEYFRQLTILQCDSRFLFTAAMLLMLLW